MPKPSADDFFAQVSDLSPAIEGLRLGEYSDLHDAEGHQYVDVVMDAGATVTPAALGYLHVLEEVGLRFLSLGGISGGSLIAIALAAAHNPSQPRVAQIIEPLARMPLADFIDGRHDGDGDALAALRTWLDADSHTLRKLWRTSRILDNFNDLHALNRGEAFHRWMDRWLREMNGGPPLTVAGLRSRMDDLPALLVSDNADASDFHHVTTQPPWEVIQGQRVHLRHRHPERLCVLSADISTQSQVQLPAMAAMYWRHPEHVNVADLARAAMSIPGLFGTFKLTSLPADEVRTQWRDLGWPERCYAGDFLPDVHHLVDGGALSNFPIDVFHDKTCVPLRPTFGIMLRRVDHRHQIQSVRQVFAQTIHTARHAMDEAFIERHPDHSKLVARIDTEDISWLDFNMPAATQLRLFRLGALSAVAFLRGFNWRDYKRIRRSLSEAYSARI